MYQRILVPTDGSETATTGLREAIKLAKVHGSRIRIFHVVDDTPVAAPQIYGMVLNQLIAQLRSAGESIVSTATELAQHAGIPVDAKMVEALSGPAGELIVQAAKDWPADLIVCGTHGRRGLRRIVMGSDAEFILRHSPVPVLVIRADG